MNNMKELRILQTPELQENIEKLKDFYQEKTNAKVVKRACKDMCRINNL